MCRVDAGEFEAISGVRGPGRPMGATSAADRKAEPPLVRLAEVTKRAGVNRACGHAVEA